MAGLDKGRVNMTRTKSPLLKQFNFIEEPKSRPMGAITLDGKEIPESEIKRPNMVPENIDELLGKIEEKENLKGQPPLQHNPLQSVNPPFETPVGGQAEQIAEVPKSMDFDLFQLAILKDIISKLDDNINMFESTLKELKSQRELLLNLLKGQNDE
jgi:hypothetical protein